MKPSALRRLLNSVLALLLISSSLPAATGGPDTYGYTWIDSNEAGGPVFQWISLSSTSRAVITGGDDESSTSVTNGIGSPVELGFPVEGVSKGSVPFFKH